MARDAGARKVYFASASPPVRFPNIYGIDMPATAELIASGRKEREVQELLGADWLIYQELPDLIESCRKGNSRIEEFDTSCFSGEYVTGVDRNYLQALETQRSDDVRARQRSEPSIQLAS
jgi:amidophosphoribosyltransferase